MSEGELDKNAEAGNLLPLATRCRRTQSNEAAAKCSRYKLMEYALTPSKME